MVHIAQTDQDPVFTFYVKALEFTSPIGIISLFSASRDFSKVSISSIVWYSYFGGLYHAITIKGLVHFCFTSMHNNSALLVLMMSVRCS